MKRFLLGFVVVIVALLALHSLTTTAVNEGKSNNHYYGFLWNNIRFIPMGNSFELGDEVIADADVGSFEVINKYYAQDDTRVYFKEAIIEGADPKSFSIICDFISRDNDQVFYQNYQLVGIDTDTFKLVNESVCDQYIIDKNSVYNLQSAGLNNAFFSNYCGQELSTRKECQILPLYGVDANTFETIDQYYARDTNAVYYSTFGSILRLPADTRTFQVINEKYSKDTKAVYYVDGNTFTEITNANPRTFSLFKDQEVYATDTRTIYCEGARLDNADASSFSLISGGSYTKDAQSVFYRCKKLEGVKPESFQMETRTERSEYATDGIKFYWQGEVQ